MSTELSVLFYTGLLSFFLLLIQGMQVPLNFGFKWGLGNRDESRDATVLMQRLTRIVNNQLESLAMAVPILLVVIVMPELRSTATEVGALMFLFGRVGFCACYLIGIPVLRSMIWAVGTIGLLVIAFEVITASI